MDRHIAETFAEKSTAAAAIDAHSRAWLMMPGEHPPVAA